MATKYIRKTGSDANLGTNATTDAVLTIARGVAVSANDDILDIGVGTWAENISSRRHYKGVSYFKTIISAVTSGWATTMAFTNIRVNSISGANHYGGNYTFTDAWCDCSSSASTSYWFAACTVITTRSILTGNSLRQYPLYNVTFPSSSSVLYNLTSASSYIFLVPSTVSMRNCIVYANLSFNVNSDASAFVVEEYNCWYSGGTIGIKPNGVFNATSLNDIDPLFKNAAGFDFRLNDNSPCIGAGHV